MDNDVFKVENLSFAYGRHQVIRELSLTLSKNRITTIIGANGCGKSTLFHLLTKNLQPERGSIFVNGKNIRDIPLKDFAREAAIVHQYNTAPVDLSVEKLISYGRTPYHRMGISKDSNEDEKKIDLRIAAEIMKGKKVAKNVRCIIIPATQQIYLEAMEEGLLKTFIQCGAVVSTPTCGPCLGGYMGVLAEGERCVSTTNRNFVGRMGHVDSEVYLASPAVAAASAIAGKIAGPAEVQEVK